MQGIAIPQQLTTKNLCFFVLLLTLVCVAVDVLRSDRMPDVSVVCGARCVEKRIRARIKAAQPKLAPQVRATSASSAGSDVHLPKTTAVPVVAANVGILASTINGFTSASTSRGVSSLTSSAPKAPKPIRKEGTRPIRTPSTGMTTMQPTTQQPTTALPTTTPTTATLLTIPPTTSASTNVSTVCVDDACGENSCCCAVEKVPDTQLTPDLNTVPDENALITRLKVTGIKEGGWWQPNGCTVEHSLAIVIPFRNREAHLLIFLQHIHPYLQRQKLAHTIYVVDQVDQLPFNRAMLFNVGYREAMAERNYTCLSFHDVDNIPVDPMLSYRCGPQPQHMAARTDKWRWGLPYAAFTGGVSKQSPGQVEKMNGFANFFWGWGGEDDDILTRWKAAGYKLNRPPSPDGRFATVKRDHFQSSKPNPQRFKLLQTSGSRMHADGLNNLKYKLVEKKKHALYTRLRVELRR
eukprot:scpid62588/ scgid16118/ Beta-1,4-galactosyltransferase 1; UDP-Gal:beta-GlcNAc beta-1,4-galactosyltransferase 1; UDP-galactose:beta-N-acetylglucosamine beta-1,4-galactosyltransferase 1; Lactose synthase A protein; N-acetyllactosamine synthase; Nal synthase; Beta-N-acetylglucosaminylglycopeptide beta-1,4-galactosyltransferase; Beta-N-acetylglucosaminyl-glycolipid beta-1,4-galactosyltransferase; Processed beta-1,4-galactosyltransferase 1